MAMRESCISRHQALIQTAHSCDLGVIDAARRAAREVPL
jgi:hypothetical protein